MSLLVGSLCKLRQFIEMKYQPCKLFSYGGVDGQENLVVTGKETYFLEVVCICSPTSKYEVLLHS